MHCDPKYSHSYAKRTVLRQSVTLNDRGWSPFQFHSVAAFHNVPFLFLSEDGDGGGWTPSWTLSVWPSHWHNDLTVGHRKPFFCSGERFSSWSSSQQRLQATSCMCSTRNRPSQTAIFLHAHRTSNTYMFLIICTQKTQISKHVETADDARNSEQNPST